MAIQWKWDDKMGECIYEDGTKVNLYQGNCLTIAVIENENNTYNLAWFFADEYHMKNMLGLAKGYDNTIRDWGIKRLRFDARYKSVPKIVSAFARAKMEIEIELYVGKEVET